jgi:hypothetical protein
MTYNEELVNDKLIKVRNRLEMAKRRYLFDLLQNAEDTIKQYDSEQDF